MRQYQNNISSNVRNITLNLKNITSHFTGKKEVITLSLTIIILSFANITLCLSNISDTSALSYSTDVNIGFTFNPTISLNISPNNLVISDLTPGTAAESNTITVNVATNTAYGYNLTANVGSNTTNYNTTNLVHATSATATSTSNATFASLAYGSSVANKDNLSPNTWGYSYSEDSGNGNNNWRPYNGLPLYSDTNHSTNLINTYTAADSKTIEFKIAASAGNTQPSGEYTNIINFYATSVPEPPLLYDVVQDMTKGTLAENNVKLSDTITQANSGVYTYDPAVYGVASDASNDYPIYFYRGILDTDAGLGTYGSDGQADAWPNYVKLSNNTCWRIVRTTGSGGTKMIYNGAWDGVTCANSGPDTRIVTRTFGLQGNSASSYWYRNINRVGYTFNDNSDIQDITTSTSADIVFGSNSNYLETNTTSSSIKDYLENMWFASNMIGYESKLESSAGYCNDRAAYSDFNTNSALSEIPPYSDFGNVYFGACGRNMNAINAGKVPSLSCPRGIVDLYSVNGASTGNGQLSKPVALLTADEVSFAGSGRENGDQGSSFNSNSYLHSGNSFWLLSPSTQNSKGYASEIYLSSEGSISDYRVSYSYGVRPVISLMYHIQVTGGTGTATSPWTVE